MHFVCSAAATLQMIFSNSRSIAGLMRSLSRRRPLMLRNHIPLRYKAQAIHPLSTQSCSENCSRLGCQQAALATLSSLAVEKVHLKLLHKAHT